jgi:D-aminopeptidase
VYHHQSGDFVLAFSTAHAYPPYLADEGELLNPLFEAAADVTEEAVIRALLCARPMTGRDGHHVPSLDRARLREIWERWQGTGGGAPASRGLDIEAMVGPRLPETRS